MKTLERLLRRLQAGGPSNTNETKMLVFIPTTGACCRAADAGFRLPPSADLDTMGLFATSRGGKPADSARRFSVYVVELDPEVFEFRKFREANPDCSRPRACLYVGMTAHSPDVRLDQHKAGYKSGKYVKRYGLRLVPELYEHHNPLYYEDACRTEVQLAEALRNRGYAVWQN